MKRRLISLAVVLGIAVIPVVVYALRSDTTGAVLRATVGRCSAIESDQHPTACAYIAAHPTIELVGPVDETGSPFRNRFYRADGARKINIRLDSGRYNVLLEIHESGTIDSNVPAQSLDMSTGDHDLGTVVPREPWAYEGVPGA
jgi:hypothetical protein